MSTIACPACSEIIPDDVDYCPFCGESTHPAPESLMTDDDLAVAERMSAIAAANTSADASGQAPVNSALKLPPEAGERVCLMCHLNPPTMGDYCLECHEKLELRPEQWDLLKQDQAKTNMVVLMVAIIALLVLALLILHVMRHAHQSASLEIPSDHPIAGWMAAACSLHPSAQELLATGQSLRNG